MHEDKPTHVPRDQYPELIHPTAITPVTIDQEQDIGFHVREYWRVIASRKWTVFACLVTVVALTLIATLKQVPVYQAQATVQIDQESQNVLTFRDVYEIQTATDDTLRTQFEVLKSRLVARRVVEALKLKDAKEFQPEEPGLLSSFTQKVGETFSFAGNKDDSDTPSGEVQDPLRPLVDRYLRNVDVRPVRLARLAVLTFNSTSPVLAANIVNAHAEQFIEQNFEFKVEATQKASDFLSRQLLDVKGSLEKSEDRLQEYSRANQILFTDEGRNTATEKLQQLEHEHIGALSDRFQRESYDRIIKAGNTDALPQLLNNQLITSLTTQLVELQREKSDLAVTFKPDYPRLQRAITKIEEIEKAIVTEKSRVVRTIEAEYAASVERERLLSDTLVGQRDAVNQINQEIIQYGIMKREVDTYKQLYDSLLTRLKEAGVSAGLRASNIRIVDRAEVPRVPIRPRTTRNILLSIAAGLIFGVGLAFFREYLDDSIKNLEDVTRYLRMPTLGIIPKMASLTSRRGYGYGYGYGYGHGREHAEKAELSGDTLTVGIPDIISHTSPSSLMAEAYRSVRTSLLLSFPDHPPKSVLVTSAVPSEGKTATAVNISISLTQTGARIVLIDSDMRKPRLHKVFGLSGVVGLSSFLTGSAPLKDVIHPTTVPGLFVLPCGVTPPNPGELILSDRFRKLLQVLGQYFDYVVLDSPPLFNVSDARVLASACDSTILVVKASSTSRHRASQALEHLLDSRGRVAGIVLNDLDVRSGAGYYYSYYKYYRPYTEAANAATPPAEN